MLKKLLSIILAFSLCLSVSYAATGGHMAQAYTDEQIKALQIPSEPMIGSAKFSITNGTPSPAWGFTAGVLPVPVADTSCSTDPGNKAMVFYNGDGNTNITANASTAANSMYLLETKIKFTSATPGTVIRGTMSEYFFRIMNIAGDSTKKRIYLGANSTGALIAGGYLDLPVSTWYHFKVVFTTNAENKVDSTRYFIDGTEYTQASQNYATPYSLNRVGFYGFSSANSDEVMRLDSMYFYQISSGSVMYLPVPTETMVGSALYINKGVAESWTSKTGDTPTAVADATSSFESGNTVLVFKNAAVATDLSKNVATVPASSYCYETKLKFSKDTNDLKISLDGANTYNLFTIQNHDATNKKIALGASANASGLILPVDTWHHFKVVFSTDGNNKVVGARYYINGVEKTQTGQDSTYAVGKIAYRYSTTGSGEVLRTDDTYFYKIPTIGISASFGELKVGGEEFNTAKQITRSGAAKIRVDVNNNTTFDTYPVVVVSVMKGNKLYDIARSDGTVKAAAGKVTFITLNNVPITDDMLGGTMKVMTLNSMEDIKPLGPSITKTVNTSGDLVMATVYSDGMILQRDMPINIAGQAPSGATITVNFNGKQTTSVAQNNRFLVKLPAETASFENRTLTISATKGTFNKTLTYKNVQVGDVYYGSGQSNMEWKMQSTYNPLSIPANVRYINISKTETAAKRVDRTYNLGEVWTDLTTSSAASCSAIMYFAAANVRKNMTDAPIGIVNCSWGGTSISHWVGEDVYLNNTDYATFKNNFYNNVCYNSGGTLVAVGSLFYHMAKPIIPYSMKAAVWYQGESDAGSEYQRLLPAMINEYRQELGYTLPYFIIQLPGFSTSNWPAFRLKQEAGAKATTDAYIVVNNDTGNNGDIHPLDKNIVGDRLGRVMLNKLYNTQIPYYGPQYKSHTVSGSTVTISFNYVNDGIHGGLCSQNTDNSLPGFELAGSDGVFKAATATIVGDTVTLTASGVSSPVYVRYGYVVEVFKSLANKTGDTILPAAPFRTDGKF